MSASPPPHEPPAELPADHAADPPPPRRLRRPLVPAGLLVLLGVLIAVVPHHSTRSRTLPPGRWGAAIACLEHDGGFRITDARNGGVPSARTREVTVTRTVRHVELAQMRDAGSTAAAHAVLAANQLGAVSRSNYRTAGELVWAYVENGTPPQVSVNAGERTLISFCAHGGRRRSPGAGRGG